MPVPSSWHPGELAAQQARGFEEDVYDRWQYYHEGAPDWMTLFLSQLAFLSVTTLDRYGRPWTSLIANDGKPGFIQASEEEHRLRITIRAPEGVPIRECLFRLYERFLQGERAFEDDGTAKIAFQMAAVGVMMHNRRRNKMESTILAVERVPKGKKDDMFVFQIQAANAFGNCPKYINTRILLPATVTATQANTTIKSQETGSDLPTEMLSLLGKADLLFLSTRYSGHDPTAYGPDPPRLGNNHRGGPAGFLRSYWDEERGRRCIVLPDWSGNRLMMSFGNMTKDPVAGIAIPIWSQDSDVAGSVMHMTCSAHVLANDEAQRLMRGVQGAVKLWVEEWSWVRHGWPMYVQTVKQIDGGQDRPVEQQVGWSPYNPPVRLLKREQAFISANDAQLPSARLVVAHFWSDQLATLTFTLSDRSIGARYAAGKHVVVDCYDLLDTRVQMYSHMAQYRGGEKDLNDDGTRSWTVSYSYPLDQEDESAPWRFELTLRRKDRGGVTPTLFRQAHMLREALEDGMVPPLWKVKMGVMGLDGSSSLPQRPSSPDGPLRLLYLLSGIGLTPILSHLSQLGADQGTYASVLAIVGTRNDEAMITQQILHHALARTSAKARTDALSPSRITIRLFLLVSGLPSGDRLQDGQTQDQASHVDQALWQSLPSSIRVQVSCLQGVRFESDSLSHRTSKVNDRTFALPDDAAHLLTDLDSAAICAGPKFARIAQDAVGQIGMETAKVHVESFAF